MTQSDIASKLAVAVCNRIANQAADEMRKITDALLSGDDSGLKNMWEELCAQVQYDQSLDWEVYEDVARDIVSALVASLPDYEQAAVWLQSDAGCSWDDDLPDAERESTHCPTCIDEIAEYVLKDYVLQLAYAWSNPRIRAYIERSSMRD